MNHRDLQNLSEAYSGLYELDEDMHPVYKRGGEQRRTQTPKQIGVKGAVHNIPKGGTTISPRDPGGERLATGEQDRGGGHAAARRAAALKKEQVDLYDIVLSHLLDEGYADSPEAAEVMMVHMSEEWRESIVEATAMAKRGLNEPAIRQKIAASTGGGAAADRATSLEDRPTYGDKSKEAQRSRYARAQRGVFRKTTSSSPGLHLGQHKSNDPAVKALQAARGAQRGVLTPGEKKQLGR